MKKYLYLKRVITSVGNACIKQVVILVIVICALLFSSGAALAAELGRYEVVVAGSGENAYLVDTVSGYVWVLTYRTLATGREPIAIPYKFIKLSPKNQKEFLVENLQQEAPFNAKEGQ